MAGTNLCTCGKRTTGHASGNTRHAGGAHKTKARVAPSRSGRPSMVAAAKVGTAASAAKRAAAPKKAAKWTAQQQASFNAWAKKHVNHAAQHSCRCTKPKAKPTKRPVTKKAKVATRV